MFKYEVFGLPHYDPYCVRENKNFFLWRQKTENKKARKNKHVVSSAISSFRKRSTSLQLVTHVVKNHQAREQEIDALREDKQRKLILYICERSLRLVPVRPLFSAASMASLTLPRLKCYLIISMTIICQFPFHNNSTDFCQSWRKNVIISKPVHTDKGVIISCVYLQNQLIVDWKAEELCVNPLLSCFI